VYALYLNESSDAAIANNFIDTSQATGLARGVEVYNCPNIDFVNNIVTRVPRLPIQSGFSTKQVTPLSAILDRTISTNAARLLLKKIFQQPISAPL